MRNLSSFPFCLPVDGFFIPAFLASMNECFGFYQGLFVSRVRSLWYSRSPSPALVGKQVYHSRGRFSHSIRTLKGATTFDLGAVNCAYMFMVACCRSPMSVLRQAQHAHRLILPIDMRAGLPRPYILESRSSASGCKQSLRTPYKP